MIIKDVTPVKKGVLRVVAADGRSGVVDVEPFFESPVFSALKEWDAFIQLRNGKYYVEWMCGADLSADTLEARMKWSA